MKISKLIVVVAFVAAVAVCGALRVAFSAQTAGSEFLVPFPSHHVMGNIYFVGSKSLGIYLITTPQGHILVNAGLAESVPGIQESVAKLGFKFSDVKILLISHAHFDHDAGAARIKELTGAKYMVMDADVPVVESGGQEDFFYGQRKEMRDPAAKVERMRHDGDTVSLGGVVLTAHLTPGHTKGCTTWTFKTAENGKTYDVVVVGSLSLNAANLGDNPGYPKIREDFAKSFKVMRTLPADVFVGSHNGFYQMTQKYARLEKGESNPFIDPAGYKALIDTSEK